MPYNWTKLNNAANFIKEKKYFGAETQDSEVTEAFQRMVISRYYYAVFNVALRLAIRISDNVEDENNKFKYNITTVHGDLKDYYLDLAQLFRGAKDLSTSLRSVGKGLITLHKKRKLCDYDDDLAQKIDDENIEALCDQMSLITSDSLDKIQAMNKKFDENEKKK